jgi:YegS/Rv2252/BmrU family lipid kinase
VSARRTVLVVNARARGGDGELDRARELLARRGVTVAAAHEVRDPAALRRTIRAELARGADRVVVGGGDGTLSGAAGVLAGTDAALGVLPLGTANDFARTLGIPPDLGRAAAVVARGQVRLVDVGRAGRRAFLNAASVGVSSALTRRLGGGLKRRAGALAYPVAGVAAAGAPPFRARIEWDGEALELRALQIVVGNGRYHGGGRLVAPRARIDDRTLDLYVVAAPARRGAGAPGRLRELAALARYAVGLVRGRHVEDPGVLHAQASRVAIETVPPLEIDADGELAGHTPAVFRVEAGALRVLAAPRARARAR